MKRGGRQMGVYTGTQGWMSGLPLTWFNQDPEPTDIEGAKRETTPLSCGHYRLVSSTSGM